LEATSSERDGEPSQFQARLVKIFLVVFLLIVPGALSFLPFSAGNQEISEFQDFRNFSIPLPPQCIDGWRWKCNSEILQS